MGKIDTKIFKTGNSVAVRLPKELGFKEGDEVTLEVEGGKIIVRKRQDTKALIQKLNALADPETQWEREPVDPADRPDW